MRTLVIALLLVALVNCEDHRVEIDKLFQLVQLGKSPAQILVDHIDSLILAIREEQQGHDEVHSVQSNECDAELTFRRKETGDAAENAKRATERRSRCNTALTLAQNDLATFLRYQTIFTEDQETSTIKRQQDAASAKKVTDNFNYVLQTLDMADTIVNDWSAAGASFAQVASHLNKLLISASKVGMVQDLAPVFALVEQGGAPSEDLASRLHGLFQTIRDKILTALAELTDQENQAYVDYNNRRERNTRVLEGIAIIIAHLRAYIKENEVCIKRETDIINAASSKRTRNQIVLDSAVDLCSAYDDNYGSNSQDRNKQILTLQKLRKFVLSKNEEFGRIAADEVFDVFNARQSQASSLTQLSANVRARQ